jgi:hypothetical protein
MLALRGIRVARAILWWTMATSISLFSCFLKKKTLASGFKWDGQMIVSRADAPVTKF